MKKKTEMVKVLLPILWSVLLVASNTAQANAPTTMPDTTSTPAATVTKTPIANSKTENPVTPATGYVEGGVERDNVTNNYGNWFNQYVKGFIQINDKNAWYGEFYHDHEFKQTGNFAKIEQTHIFNDDFYTTVSVGMSDNSIFVPKYYVGGTLFNKQLDKKQLIFYLGVHAYWWRPDSSTEDVNPGLVYYFEKPWTIEAGLYINRSNPGVIYTASGYVAVTQGTDKDHYITLRYGLGKESYLPLGPNIAVVGYPSYVVTVTWRQWIGKNWGTNIVAERYHNTFYDRSGLTVGVFKDFSL